MFKPGAVPVIDNRLDLRCYPWVIQPVGLLFLTGSPDEYWINYYINSVSMGMMSYVHPDVNHDDVIKWKHFPRNWPFVREIHRSPVNFPHKGQWRGALMFSLIYAWINDWVNNREAGDLRRQHGHYDVIVMNGGTSKLQLNLMHGSTITSNKRIWVYLYIYAPTLLNSLWPNDAI